MQINDQSLRKAEEIGGHIGAKRLPGAEDDECGGDKAATVDHVVRPAQSIDAAHLRAADTGKNAGKNDCTVLQQAGVVAISAGHLRLFADGANQKTKPCLRQNPPYDDRKQERKIRQNVLVKKRAADQREFAQTGDRVGEAFPKGNT